VRCEEGRSSVHVIGGRVQNVGLLLSGEVSEPPTKLCHV
jgi:hypothetical protein